MASVSSGLGTERSLAESRIERNGIKPGTRAPGFSLPSVFEGTVSLDDYRGRPVLLVFSDPQCGPCEELAPSLVRLACEHSGLQVLMVSRGDVEANRAKAREHRFPFPVVLQDGWKLSKEYGMFATPIAFSIDERGFTTHDVAVGAGPILALAESIARPLGPMASVAALAITRLRAIGRIAAALVAGFLAEPLLAVAQSTCPPGQVNCAGTCTVLGVDSYNCGACGKTCGAGTFCYKGACLAGQCPMGLIRCAGVCTSLSDPRHCGACGNSCMPGSTCSGGQCSCPSGHTICNNPTTHSAVCTILASDPNNCGACGKKCASGKCANGVCA